VTHPLGLIPIFADHTGSARARDTIELAKLSAYPSIAWPPMSPISTSFFVCWSTYDLGIGARRETLGHVIIAVAAECGTAS
jgi:hypothetical protein